MSPTTLISLLQHRAGEAPDQRAFTFLEDDGSERHITHGELDRRARTIAAALLAQSRPGERALLLFAPGLEYIEALFGCLYAGVLAVPAYPPDVMRLQRTLPRLQAIAADSGASLLLTTQGIQLLAGELMAQEAPELGRLRWVATDALAEAPGDPVRIDDVAPQTLAFLQYTSGSTGTPKGVMLSHANLMHNCALIHRAFGHGHDSRGVIWLPPYHDMGLIGGILQPLYGAFPTVLMSPLGFLSRPLRWLQAVSEHRATTSGGPNFAYDLCVRKTTPEQRAALDLSSWRVAFSGAEPIRTDTLDRFVEAFGPSGFRREAFYPCYGLAEATLIVSGGRVEAPPVVTGLDAEAYARGQVADARPGGREPLRTVGCGEPLAGLEVRIVEPESRQPCAPDRVGEIWVRGGSVATGYWGQPETSRETYQARLASGEEGTFLRTGDLGFLRGGELFVTGRLKDLIIIRGRNHYPQDIERTVEQSHPALRPGCGAAFPVEVEAEERLVVVQELDPRQSADVEQVLSRITEAVTATHEVRPHAVLLIKPGSLPKTSSGKVQRRACRALHAAGELDVLASTSVEKAVVADADAAPRGDVEQQLAGMLADCLRLAPERLDRRASITTLGLDSLSAVELQSQVEARFGVALSIGALLDGPSLGVLAERVAAAHPAHALRAPSEASVPAQHPLSRNQQALWFLQQLSPTSPVNNVACAVRMRGAVSPSALRAACQALVERHPALRTTFASVNHQPVARIASTAEVAFSEQDATAWSDPALAQHLADEARRPFALEQGPLMRVELLRRGPDTWVLFLCLHHLVTDFWSMALIARELGALYTAARQGTAATLPAAPHSFADHVHWEEQVLAGPDGERHRQYWERQLGGEPLVLDTPTDRPRPSTASLDMHSARLCVSAEMAGRLRRLATHHGATLHAVVLAAYQTLLSRWSGQAQVRVGSYASGRGRAGLESLVGYIVNPLVLHGDLDDAPSFPTLLKRTHRTLVDGLAHQPYPFMKLVEHFQPQRDRSRAPLFQAAMTWLRTPGDPAQGLIPFTLGGEDGRLEWSGLLLESLPPLPRYQETDVWMELGETGEGLCGLLHLRADLFDATTAERLASHLVTLLEGIAEDPERPVTALPLLTPAERERVLHAWNPPHVAPAAEPCLHQAFEAQVLRTPEAIAVCCEGRQLTYAELNRRANQLAHRMGELGVRPGDTVGLSLERSLDMVVALLGTLKAGAAYLPVDSTAPRERVAWMVEDARPALILAHAALASRLPEDTPRLLLDEARDALERQPGHDPRLPVRPEHLMYVIYTSGTTGRPKGVMVSHANITRFMSSLQSWFQLDGQVVSTLFHSIAFDVSVLELWGALLYGGRLVVVTHEVSRDPTRFYALLREERVTFASQTPSAFRGLLATEQAQGVAKDLALRTLVLCGEKLEPSLLRPWFEAHGDAVPWVANMYGPTETSVYSMRRRMRAEDVVHGRSVLGESLRDMWHYVLDRHLEPLPVGFTGELFIGGTGVTAGYLRRPELTAQRFLPDPFRAGEEARLYRSGDLVRRLPDGDIEYLCRMDNQVKLRGFRVELGEIEAVLTEQPEVRQAVAHVREDVPGTPVLVGYVVLRPGQALEPSQLRRALGTRLPEYMIPTAFVALEALPLNQSGKLDRRALPAPGTARAQAAREAPRTPLESELATLWAELLRVEVVGVEESFFELGGHSLLATQLVSRVREQLGVELPLRALFEEPTVAGLARRVEQARAGRVPQVEAPTRIGRALRSETLELSFAQQRMWFLDQLSPASASYHISGALRLQGALEAEVLRRALEEVVRRHESLRTTFPTVAGKPSQVIHPPGRLELPVVDLGALPEAVRRAEVERQALAEAQRSFDLGSGPLFRVRLLRLSAEEHVLVLSMHHIISDGWSLEVLARETAALHGAFSAGQPSPLPELPIQYADYAAWQREWLRGEELQRQLSWWREQLAGAPPVLELPTDRPRPPVQGFWGARLPVELGPELAQAVRELARREGATLFMTLMAAFQALLHRYANQSDVVVGTPIAHRTRMETEPLIGFFANTLALRADLAKADSFRALLAQVKQTALGAFAHQALPFERLVEELQPTRSLSHAPVFQVMFALQEPMRSLALPGLTLTRMELEQDTAKFELLLTLEDTGRGITGAFEYSTDLFDADTVRRLAHHFTTLLQGFTAHPELPLDAVPLLGAEERARVLQEFQPEARPSEPFACLHTLFEAQAARTPEALAVLHGERALTYRELNTRANQLARHLRAQGVGAEDRVGLCLERSPELVVSLLGILKAGAAYVPMDPSYPREHLRWLGEDARLRALITHQMPSDAEPGERRIHLERDEAAIASQSGENLAPTTAPEGVAYVLYTSGSTGTPKGVMVPHAALHNHMRWMQREFPLAPGDRVLQRTPISFDASVWEFHAPLLAGATLVMGGPDAHRDPTDILRTIQRDQVSTLQLVPTLLQQVLELPQLGACPSLRRVFCGGEALTPELVERFASRLPSARLINLYGPTEATIDASFHVCTPGQRRRVPIGRPIDDTRLYVLDSRLEPTPVGVPGELFIAGAGLGRGYLGRAGLTAERFLPDPFGASPGARMYRTGDVALYRPDGQVEYLGRRDHQVKLRGVRIELPEIEATLARHPRVRRAVVTLRTEASGPRLVAHVEARDVEGAELRAFMTARLPSAMVPSAYVALDALPLLPNGKVDRRSLPAPDAPASAEAHASVAPRDDLEAFLARTWEEVLGVPRVGIHDDFFALGGHSLLATQVMSRAREHLHAELPLRLLFESPTVARLAEALARYAPTPTAPPAASTPRSPPEFLLDQVDQMTPEQLDRLLAELDGPENAQ